MTPEQVLWLFDECHTDKGSGHGYHTVYADILPDIQSVFEIGVCGGASMQAWLNLFPTAKVYGIDISMPKLIEHERLTLIHQDILEFDPSGYPNFDLIIDDGSHITSDILAAWDKLKSKFNHFYIIEDVTLTAAPDLIGHLSKSLKSLPGTWQLEVIQTGTRYPDDRVIRITKC